MWFWHIEHIRPKNNPTLLFSEVWSLVLFFVVVLFYFVSCFFFFYRNIFLLLHLDSLRIPLHDCCCHLWCREGNIHSSSLTVYAEHRVLILADRFLDKDWFHSGSASRLIKSDTCTVLSVFLLLSVSMALELWWPISAGGTAQSVSSTTALRPP